MKAKQLNLRLDRRWGGRREGAGRKRGPNPRIAHASRGGFPVSVPVHVTLKVRADVPSLRSERFVREIARVFPGCCERRDARLVHYSIQSNHAHLIVEAHGPAALGRAMKSIGSRFALAVNRVFQRRGPVLVDRYHMQPLRTPRQVRNALAYVLLNARKHAGGRGRPPHLDQASSGRWFDGWSDRARGALGKAPVAAARTWLLQTGWRRHGLIDPAEVPGTG